MEASRNCSGVSLASGVARLDSKRRDARQTTTAWFPNFGRVDSSMLVDPKSLELE